MNGIAARGNKKEAYDFLEKVKLEHPDQVLPVTKAMIDGLISSNCCKEAYLLIKQLYSSQTVDDSTVYQAIYALTGILEEDNKAGRRLDEDLILKTMMMIGANDCSKLRHHLSKVSQPLPLENLFIKAEKFREIMSREDMTFNQVLAMSQSEMRMFLLQGLQLMQREGKQSLSADMFFEVVKFLSPMERLEVYDLANKVALKTCTARLFHHKEPNKFLLMDELKHSEALQIKKSI
jgi:hypothetical protein